MSLTHEIEVKPAFHEFDPLAVVWHGHYVKYLELARSALMQQFHYDYAEMAASGYAWPIVDMRLKYVRPAKFGQLLIVRSTLVEWEHRLKVQYLISERASGQKLTEAYTIQVAVDMKTGEMQFASPQILLHKLGRAET